jgi:hypothetical protein
MLRDLRVLYRAYKEPTFCGTYFTLFNFVLYPTGTVLRAALLPVFMDIFPHVFRFGMICRTVEDYVTECLLFGSIDIYIYIYTHTHTQTHIQRGMLERK